MTKIGQLLCVVITLALAVMCAVMLLQPPRVSVALPVALVPSSARVQLGALTQAQKVYDTRTGCEWIVVWTQGGVAIAEVARR